MLPQILTYTFMHRAFEAGIIVAVLLPLIGIFLVLRRYALIADTLAHISLLGVATGLLLGLNPVLTAIAVSSLGAIGIEKLRNSKRIYADTALALFLSGSLALAVVILSWGGALSADLFSYLFGSISTVTQAEVFVALVLSLLVIGVVSVFFKELVFISFDEEAAMVSGINAKLVNIVLIVLAALSIAISIPIAGVLLVTALMVIPVVTALQFKKSFIKTILISEVISILAVISGIVVSFYFDISAGGAIVLVALLIFGIVFLLKR